MSSVDATPAAAETRPEWGPAAPTESPGDDPPIGIPPAPLTEDDPITAALIAMAELSKEMRTADRELRQRHHEAVRDALASRVADLRAKADSLRQGAIGSALVLAGAAAAYTVQFGRSQPLSADTSPDAGATLAGNAGNLAVRAADLPSSFANAAATIDEANAEGHAADAEGHRARAEDTDAGMRAAEDLRRRVLETLSGIEEARNGTLDRLTRA